MSTARTSGVATDYEQVGGGPALVCVHGAVLEDPEFFARAVQGPPTHVA